MSGAIGFACQWARDRRSTWSGTPWRLRQALAAKACVVDIDATVPRPLREALRLAYVRRDGRRWRSMWGHGRPAIWLGEHRLRSQAARVDADVILQIQDLGVVASPYFVLQDLSYDLLLDHFGGRGVPHFRNLTRTQILRLRDRQTDIYRQATGLLPMSRWLADRTRTAGITTARLHVVNPGVNVPLDPAAPVPERRRGDERRLLFVGRDFETKAGDQVVAAFALLRKQFGPRISLTIAGPKSWPLSGPPPAGVSYLGAVPPDQVQHLYDTHDLFVMPSRFEGFGIAFVEALVRGLPCIGRNACAMPEIIDPTSGGRLVSREDPEELAEAVVAALSDDDLYAACAARAPLRRAHYTWERAADQIVTALTRR